MEPIEISKHKFPSHPRYSRFFRQYAFNLSLDMGFTREVASNIQVSISEALANVIQHAYKNQHDLPIVLEFYKYETKLEIHIQDYGVRVPRGEIKSRPLDEVRESGLGVYIMEKFMDYINYNTSGEKGTLLIMTKNLT